MHHKQYFSGGVLPAVLSNSCKELTQNGDSKDANKA